MDYSKYLINNELFVGLSENELKVLSSVFHVKTLVSGTYVFQENSIGDELYIVLDGKVAVSIQGDEDKKSIQIATVEKKQLLGEFAIVDESPRSASAVCIEDTKLLTVTKNDFDRLLENHKGIGFVIMKNLATILCERLRVTNMRWRNSVLFFSMNSKK